MMKQRLVPVALLLLGSGCASLSKEAVAGISGVLGAGGAYLATNYVQGRMRCGDLQGFTARRLSTGWEIPGVRSALSAHFQVSEEALTTNIHSSDITLANAISAACYLVDRYPRSDTIQALTLRMLEAASAPRLVVEEAMRQVAPGAAVPETEKLLQNQFRQFAGQLKGFADSVQRATRENPSRALTESVQESRRQQQPIEYYLRVLLNDSPRSVETHYAVQSLLANVSELRRELEAERVARTRAEGRIESMEAATRSGLSGLAELRFLTPIAMTYISFETGSYVPDDTAVARLVAWASEFRGPQYSFSLTGSTDPRGGSVMNQTLSEARARYVRNILIEQASIPPLRISMTGIGVGTLRSPSQLDDPNRRRVQIIVHGSQRDNAAESASGRRAP
jgi:outer membrane protein OmpA-like peptidoglycan-associated protein